MSEEIKNQTRRSAIKTAAQVAVTAPAVAMLLSGSAKAVSVGGGYADAGTIEGPTDYNDDSGPIDDPFPL